MRITELPSALAKTARVLRQRTSGLDAEGVEQLQTEARMMETAQLYWVTSQMRQVALDAAIDLPQWTVQQVMPTPIGMVFFDGGLPSLTYDAMGPSGQDAFGRDIYPRLPVDYLQWYTVGSTLRIVYGCTLDRVHSLEVGLNSSLSLIPMGILTLPDIAGTHDVQGWMAAHTNDPEFEDKVSVLSLLGATWSLMTQEGVATQRTERVYASKADQRNRRSPALVTTITLRKLRHVEAETEPSGRILHHRFYVRGHWRNQACGPGLTQRKPMWISGFLKGPSGAPLLVREHVSVWRR